MEPSSRKRQGDQHGGAPSREVDSTSTKPSVLLADEAGRPSIVSSIRLGLLPTNASLASAGIVTIPGMMAGQVIAGGDPLNAGKYQFVVFAAIAALTLLADGLIMTMVYRTCFTKDDQYAL